MKKYICPTCSKSTEIPNTKLEPISFCCPFCLSISKITNGKLSYVTKFKNEIHNNYTFIGEKITFKSKTYHVVGISTKQDTASKTKWNEYIVANYNGDLFFLSHGNDFSSYLKEFPYSKIENSVKNAKPFKYKSNNYSFDFAQNAITYSGQGIFFNDITTSAFLRTYHDEIDDSRFISVEKYNKNIEAFEGNYISSSLFKSLFAKLREQKYLQNNTLKNVVLFFGILSILLGVLHFVLNYKDVNSYSYESYIIKNNYVNEIVSTSFKVKENNQKVKLNFISEVKNTNINVTVVLVNEITNEHLKGGNFTHFFNSSNQASGNQITFCNLNKGDYHLVFTYTEPETKTDQEYAIDYKVTVGGTSFTYLYIFIIICFITAFIYFEIIKNQVKIKENQTLKQLITYNRCQIIIIALVIIAAYTLINYLFVSNINCNSNIENKELENATYTGSRSHYVYRTYSSSGSHK